MNWEIVGSTGEWAGAIAVVVTLYYLARQIRQQNEIAKYNAWASVIDGFNKVSEIEAQDAEMSRLMRLGFDRPDELNDDELQRWSDLIRIYMNNIHKAHVAHRQGFLDDAVWSDIAENFAGEMRTPGGLLFRRSYEGVFSDMWSAIDDAAGTDGLPRVDYGMRRDVEASAS